MHAYIALASVAGALAAYTFSFQAATLYWGKRLAPDNDLLPTGLQDAITPPAQTRCNLLSMVLLAITLIAGFFVFRWYWALVAFFVIYLGSALLKALLPKPDSDFFRERIESSLRSRLSRFQSSGDTGRAEAVSELLNRFDHEVTS